MITLDTLGTLYTPGTYDSEGAVLVAPVALPGYHVNATHPVAGWEAYNVVPEAPRRLFGGAPTYFYTFADEAEFDALLEDADLSYDAEAVALAKPPTVDVITYKMLFTSTERIAVKASTDPVIIDLQDLMNDPRTENVDLSLQSVSDALSYMTYIGLIAPGRKEQILTGKVL